MTYEEEIVRLINQLNLLLESLQLYTEEDKQRFEILEEIQRIRQSMRRIEEMTKTERQRPMRMKTVIIESSINYN